MDPAIFKAYGIRGIYLDHINKEGAWKMDCATVKFLRSLLSVYKRGQANYNSFKISGLQVKPVGADTGLKDMKHVAMALLHTKGTVTSSVKVR